MKVSAVAAVAMASLVSAQAITDIPACAIPCLHSAMTSKTNCSVGDVSCVCKKENQAAMQGAATECVIAKCGMDKAISEVLPATEKVCAEAGKSSNAAAKPAAPAAAASPAANAAAPAPAASSSSSTRASTATSTSVAVKPCSSASTVPQASVACNATGPRPPVPTNAVTAGAAGVAPLGALALMAIGALAL